MRAQKNSNLLGSIQTGRVAPYLSATISPAQKCIHTDRVEGLLMHSGLNIQCGHYSVIIVGIRNIATTSDWLISLSRLSNAALIERIPTPVSGRSECSD